MIAPILRSLSRAPWLVLLIGCIALLVSVETLLLGLATGFFGSGYNSPHIDRLTFAFGYLPGAVLLDLWLVLSIWTVTVPLLSRMTSSRLQIFCASALLAVSVPVALAGLRYDAYETLGAMFSVALLSQSSNLGMSELLSEAIGEAPQLSWMLLLLGLEGLVYWLAARWIDRRFGSFPRLTMPSPRALAFSVLASGSAAALSLIAAVWTNSALQFGFEQKLSGAALSELINRITDVDRDGFGALERPRDPAPFDSDIYPYAVDQPGNGRDENGLAGDLPVELDPEPAQSAPVAFEKRPHVLLVYLESFRPDLLGQEMHGREITPFLNRLAREGGTSAHAYVHAPWTLDSRIHFWTGSLVPRLGETTLVDDFKSRGYTVAWFSGQDDSYGNSAHRLGAERADVFYDARQDVLLRTSHSVAPISLQVSWKTLTRRALDFLSRAYASEPIFLYLNVVDTHYPYTHSQLDAILDVESLERDGIRADRAREVFASYANTAANVDRAVEVVFDAFRRRIGGAPLAVVVTSDHSEAFYEYGSLGHGQSLDAIETRVPFIVWGLGGEWPEPISSTDFRPLLMRNLGTAASTGTARPRFVPEPGRQLLQYTPSIEQPRYIALRGLDGAVLFDFVRDGVFRVRGSAADGAVPEPLALDLARSLIWRWEAFQRRALEPKSASRPAAERAEIAAQHAGLGRAGARPYHGRLEFADGDLYQDRVFDD